MNQEDRSVNVMIEQNNRLREKLVDENKVYYERLLVYVRTAGLFYDDYEVENLLLQILQDILSAQNDGQSAVDFFGKNPQMTANELIANLGKASWKEKLKLTLLVFTISSFFIILNILASPERGINILALFLNGLLSFLFIELIFLIVHKSIYLYKTFILFLLLWLSFSIFIGLSVSIQLFSPSLLILFIPDAVGIGTISALLIGITITLCKRKRREWFPFVPFIYILGLIGIVSRLPATAGWMAGGSGKISIALFTGLGLILYWGLTFLFLRKKRENKWPIRQKEVQRNLGKRQKSPRRLFYGHHQWQLFCMVPAILRKSKTN
ncbi:hypothetical protein OYT88_19520 [Sporolactobacillus sp. CQH2019]|uniref:hypothetical protein n=1 Tax=Sporolactobacillus sp. CQH2019 TaxID=3023512 RepID=UPI00236786F4|nr:hypothetical protein [Sporolactobacillus sp. CQH2019]MDD9150721.1 hypothetical protein [Sporolactobacillus sp. CQH2019]